MEMIALNDLTIGYRHKCIAKHLQATLSAGSLTCLLGSNGVGKSTLLNTMSGALPPLCGTVSIAGESITAYSAKALAKQMSIVLTRPIAAQQLDVNELVAMGRYPYTNHWGSLTSHDDAIVTESLSLVGMEAFAQRKVGTLSDGERQKVMIAKALAQQTPIILLDEPTAFLDFPSKIEMLKLLKQLAHRLQKTILLSTHDLAFALKMADNLWLMQAGKLDEGAPKLLADTGVLAHYINQEHVTFNPQTMEISWKQIADTPQSPDEDAR